MKLFVIVFIVYRAPIIKCKYVVLNLWVIYDTELFGDLIDGMITN